VELIQLDVPFTCLKNMMDQYGRCPPNTKDSEKGCFEKKEKSLHTSSKWTIVAASYCLECSVECFD